MAMRLEIQNFRGLRNVDWEFDGVCALAGPNGAGKTSLLEALAFLRDAYRDGVARAVDQHGGTYGFRHFDAPDKEPTLFRLTVGGGRWCLEPVLHGSTIGGPASEQLECTTIQGPTLGPYFRREAGAADVHIFPWSYSNPSRVHFNDSPFLPEFVRRVQDRDPALVARVHGLETSALDEYQPARHVPPLDAALRTFRLHAGYRLAEIRRHGSQSSSDDVLAEDGRNVFALLRNWRDRRATRDRFEFVLDSLHAAFPEMFHDMDFEVAGSTVTARIYRPDSRTGVPIEIVANGFLVALLHLCAVASLPEHGFIAIDEPENGLHPFAIDELLASMRSHATRQKATVLLATHSPALLDRFHQEPGRVFVIEPGMASVPVALDKHRDPEWLKHFSLGSLFLEEDYGAPRPGQAVLRNL